MKSLVLVIVGLFLFLSAKTQNKDTLIEVYGNSVTGGLGPLYSNSTTLFKQYDASLSNFCLIDTALNCYYETKSNGQGYLAYSEQGEIYGFNLLNGGLSKYIDQNNYLNLAKNERIIPHFGLELKGNKLIVLPDYASRDSLQNLFIQQLVIGDSLIKVYSIKNSQKHGFCYLGNQTNNKTPYLLTAKPGFDVYEFGYFDSVFNKYDTIEFKHPVIIPNKPAPDVTTFFSKGNKLIVAGEQRAKDATHINVRIPYKFEVDLKTGAVSNIYVDTITKYGALYSRFWPNIQFDKWGNLMATGQASNAGFLQVIDTNNQLLIDTLIKYKQSTINATDFIYHIGGGRAILGGSYDANGNNSAAVWYKKFNLKDWYLKTVGIEENTFRQAQGDLVLYPNPVKNQLYLETEWQEFSYSIFDIAGKQIITGINSKLINTSKLANGIYTLSVNNKGQNQVLKFVVSK
jgi:hypothetical protein